MLQTGSAWCDKRTLFCQGNRALARTTGGIELRDANLYLTVRSGPGGWSYQPNSGDFRWLVGGVQH